MKLLDGIIDSMDMSLSKLQETERTEEPGLLQSLASQRVEYNSSLLENFSDVLFS